MSGAFDLMARAAFHVGPLEPVPGWYFGQWDRRDPRAWARRALWRLARERNYDGPVTTGWYFGLRFNHHLSGDMSQCTYVDGRYEPNEMYAMAQLIKPGMCFVDVGANAGIFTIMAARLTGERGVVHAFEPSPRDRVRLEANISLNRLTNVTVHSEALGRSPGKAVLTVSGAERPGHNTIGGFMYAEDAAAYSIEVEVTTLDDVAEATRLTRLDVMKVDVEGFETAVLQGGRAALARFRPVMVVEAQDESLRQAGSSASELLALVRELDYEVKVFGPSGMAEPVDGERITGLNLLCVPQRVERPVGRPTPAPSQDR